ncbi:MAG: FGGY-family carbohydrate kinase [Clostridia bacterium]|nr:FGGY-family carbohydrate kinase [Clostridia bacterium]
MSDAAFVGIDIGTSTVKAGIWRNDGGFRAAYGPAEVLRLPGGGAEQDPHVLWNAATACLRQVLYGQDPQSIKGIGLSGHGPSLLAVDSNGKPLCNVITWMDERPGRDVAASDSLAAAACGSQGAPSENHGPSFEGTALWILSHLACEASAAPCAPAPATFLQPKDFIGLRLTGEACIDSSAASCMAWFSRCADGFPRVVESWQPIGRVSGRFAQEAGLPEGIPAAAGGIDAFVEALGVGAIEPGIACESTGTSTCISAVAPDCADLPTVEHVIPGVRLSVTPISFTGGALSWAMSVLFPEAFKDSRDWSHTVAEALQRSAPGAAGLTFIPHLIGERSPRSSPGAAGAFVGLRPGHNRFDMLRAVLEGCAYAARESLQVCAPSLGVAEFRAVGSGAKHEGWLQMKADVMEAPVARMAVRDGALLGAIMLAGIAAGEFTDAREAVRALVRQDERFEPRDSAIGDYRRGYAAYCRTEKGLEEMWRENCDLSRV